MVWYAYRVFFCSISICSGACWWTQLISINPLNELGGCLEGPSVVLGWFGEIGGNPNQFQWQPHRLVCLGVSLMFADLGWSMRLLMLTVQFGKQNMFGRSRDTCFAFLGWAWEPKVFFVSLRSINYKIKVFTSPASITSLCPPILGNRDPKGRWSDRLLSVTSIN